MNMENKKFNIFVNIILVIIVIAFIFGTIYNVIKFNREHETLESMGYNEEIINQIRNEQ